MAVHINNTTESAVWHRGPWSTTAGFLAAAERLATGLRQHHAPGPAVSEGGASHDATPADTAAPLHQAELSPGIGGVLDSPLAIMQRMRRLAMLTAASGVTQTERQKAQQEFAWLMTRLRQLQEPDPSIPGPDTTALELSVAQSTLNASANPFSAAVARLSNAAGDQFQAELAAAQETARQAQDGILADAGSSVRAQANQSALPLLGLLH